MELFSVFGISNAEILTAAACVFLMGVVISLAQTAFSRSRAGIEGRVERLEVRLAAATAARPILNQADDLVREVAHNAVEPAIEIFDQAPRRRTLFGTGPGSHELAAALASELRDNVETAAEIARPIRNMIENGAIEVSAERARLAADLRDKASQLGSATWKEHGRAVLASGVPTRSSEAVITCFMRVRKLRAALNAMGRRPSAEQMLDVLTEAAGLVEDADRANTIFADDKRSATSGEAA